MAAVLLLLCRVCWCAPRDLHAWHWQRTVTPAASAGDQCVVLDSELYARAAPGLRDVRLLQGGREVPYALEESFDEPALNHPANDRAVYTTVLRIPLQSVSASQRGTHDADQVFWGTAVLPAHVPVERMQLEPVAQGLAEAVHTPVLFSLTATPRIGAAASTGGTHQREQISEMLPAAAAPVELTALGANLQNDATVSVAVQSGRFAAVLLQMRQRLLCFRPLDAAPVTLLFGNEQARPVRYDFSTLYHPLATPALAQLGPVQVNPAYREPATRVPFWTMRHGLLLLCLLVPPFLLLMVALPRLAART